MDGKIDAEVDARDHLAGEYLRQRSESTGVTRHHHDASITEIRFAVSNFPNTLSTNTSRPASNTSIQHAQAPSQHPYIKQLAATLAASTFGSPERVTRDYSD